MPAHLCSLGKAMLATRSDEEIRNLYSRGSFETLTEHSISTLDDLCEDLNTARVRGFAFDNQESHLGVQCVARAVQGAQGRILAGLSVSAPSVRMKYDVFAEAVVAVADELAELLQYHKP
ncbi:MAG: hypothetical protein ETSY1_15105 [Candidatus Entotheonella factor]|uniref:IclR-ED domain-containing protein n=1 Tax=Entotheonella factor TaxID=1429438 RepID=W4LN67_ENTF1|nr:MAG: hypothetical protein ETSY1_15105 [Candidatus Entotheonella factor]